MAYKQKFNKFDMVRIADDLGQGRSHFPSGVDAIVIEADHGRYVLFLKRESEVAWYYDRDLTLLASNCENILNEWKLEIEQENKLKSDLDWIFENGEQVLKEAHGSSMAALGKCVGIHNLWGPRGEGFDYFCNVQWIVTISKDYLLKNDRKGWEEFCKKLKQQSTT